MTEPLTDEKIIALITAKEERPDLDFKGDINLSGDKKDKAEITKDVIAMANYGGGLIVGGVPETATGFLLAGMPEASLKSFDSTALNDFVKNYADPPVNTTTRKQEFEGKVYGVIVVPGFATQPHIVTRDYPDVMRAGDILIRTASNSSERAGADDVRVLIEQCVSRRKDVLAAMLQAALPENRPVLIGRAPESVEPIRAPFDQSKYSGRYKGFRLVITSAMEEVTIPLTRLRPALDQAVLRGPSGREHYPPFPFGTTLEKRLPIGIVFEREEEYWPRLAFLSLGATGNVFCAESLWEDTRWPPETQGSLSVFSSISTLYSALLFARQYYPAIGYHGQVHVEFSQESSVPRILQMDSSHLWPFPERYHNAMATPLSVARVLAVESDLSSVENLTIDMSIEFFWHFHYDLDQNAAARHLDHVKTTEVVVPASLRGPAQSHALQP